MKNTGIIRRVDDLGRIVIPKEIRNSLRVREGDPLEIYLHENMVCFKKLSPMTNNQGIVDIAMKMAKRENLSIAIYDTDKMLAEEGDYPTTVSDEWREDSLHNLHTNFYTTDFFMFPIVSNGELCGFIAAKKNQLVDGDIESVDMIANYLSIALEKNETA